MSDERRAARVLRERSICDGGGSKLPNVLAQNLAFSLRSGLRGKGCQVFVENARLVLQEQENKHYTYPNAAAPRTVRRHDVAPLRAILLGTEG